MSRENVDLVRRAFDAWNRGDFEAALNVAADDLEMDWSNSIGPLRGVYRGREEILDFISSFIEPFDSLEWDQEELIEVDESHVIVVNRVRIRGGHSGVEADATGAQLWAIAEGEARRIKLYQSKAEALEAAGKV